MIYWIFQNLSYNSFRLCFWCSFKMRTQCAVREAWPDKYHFQLMLGKHTLQTYKAEVNSKELMT